MALEGACVPAAAGLYYAGGARRAGRSSLLKLKKSHQFSAVYKRGRSFKKKLFILYIASNKLNSNRVGVSISSRCAPLSVHRNRSKRLLLEAYRQSASSLLKGHDLVFVCREDLFNMTTSRVKEEADKLYKKANILK